MAAKRRSTKPLSTSEIEALLKEGKSLTCGPRQFAEMINVAPSTVYQWLARGHLKPAARKRGKRWLIMIDHAIHIVFYGPEWRP